MTLPVIDEVPPLDGSINVLPGFVDFHANHNPDRPLFVFPYPNLSSDEVRSVSFLEFAQATHRIAHAFRPKREGPEGAVVAIVANVDTILYHAILAGLARAGCVPFPMSPRNPAIAIASMMKHAQCHRIISQPAFAELMAGVRGELPPDYAVQVDEPPALASIFPALALSSNASLRVPERYPPPPHEPEPTSLALYLHSSGSTGHPKPVPLTHGFVRQWCTLPSIVGGRLRRHCYGSHPLPSFHTMAVAVQLFGPLVSGYPTITFPPNGLQGAPPVVPTPQNTLETARKVGCNIMLCVPAFLEAWANSDDDIEYLKTMQTIIVAGGPLSKVNGDKLVARGVRLTAGYGTTEIGTVSASDPLIGKTAEEWDWMFFPEDIVKTRWVDQGDGTYELQLLNCPTHRPAVQNLQLPNGERGYSTSDLWIPHPTKPGLWKIVGRNDDVIVLGSGM
ncbi:hypothetical protein EVJ58_g989 [Rhodofomes roseus]|uniref:AMP-dependent synthetase/ligase domain-containing protein n=1 Tax=Rhodofomes roseus TaxID=34475 RepID=A0A4Y9Z5A5_9APHY|nr:hypothetical protein EVJ58_g989 [Rhodofomes roseus]